MSAREKKGRDQVPVIESYREKREWKMFATKKVMKEDALVEIWGKFPLGAKELEKEDFKNETITFNI